MEREHRRSQREFSQILERQMRLWELGRGLKEDKEVQAETPVQPFVALGRAVGLPGLRLSHKLGEKLGWPVYVRQVLQAMAGDDVEKKKLYASMEGRDMGWFEEMVRSMGFAHLSQDDYFRRLTATVLALAKGDKAVFLGRAADMILPQDVGFRVQLTASRDFCLKAFAKQTGSSLEEATRAVGEIERERKDFLRNHFKIDSHDPSRFDMIINMERFTEDQAIELIMAGLKMRGIG